MTDHDPLIDGDDIAPHLVQPLRAAERLDDTFPARVMSAVHAEARGQERTATARESRASRTGWWRRQHTVRLSPLGGLAMAAGLAGLAVLAGRATSGGDRLVRGRETSTPLARAVPETVHVVRFVFTDSLAKSVSLVGDFNAWARDATPLAEHAGDGTWVVSVELPRGRHEYAFVVRRERDERWAADPFALPVRDDFGTESSIVTVGGPPYVPGRAGTT